MKNMVIINKFLLYGPMIPKPIWALEHGSIVWPKAQPLSRPESQSKPIKTTSPSSELFKRPKERAADASSHLALLRGPCLACCHRAKLQSFGHTTVCMPGSALGDIAAEHICWSENHFQNHSHLKPTYN